MTNNRIYCDDFYISDLHTVEACAECKRLSQIKMKLYLIFEYDNDGSTLCDIFTNKDKAAEEAAEYNKKYYRRWGGRRDVEEWEIQE